MATPRILSLFKKARATITGLVLTAIGATGAQAADFTHAEEGYAFPEKGQGVWSVTEDANAQYGLNLKFTDVLKASGLKENSVIHADTKIVLPGLAEKIAADNAEAERVAEAARIQAARQAEIQRLVAEEEAKRLAAIEAERIEDARIAAELQVEKDEAAQLLANANAELLATQTALNDAKEALAKAESDYAGANDIVVMEKAELAVAETALADAQQELASAQATAATAPAAPVSGTAPGAAPATPVVDPVAVAQAEVDEKLQEVDIAKSELSAAQTAAFDAGANVTAASSDKTAALVDVSDAEQNVDNKKLVFDNASLIAENNTLQNQVEAKGDEVESAAAALADAQAALEVCQETCPVEPPLLGPKARPDNLDVPVVAVPNEHLVEKGDELCEIAAKYDLSAAEIFEANPEAFGFTDGKRDPGLLYAGATLNLEGLEKTDKCGCGVDDVAAPVVVKAKPVVPPVIVPTAPPASTAACSAVSNGRGGYSLVPNVAGAFCGCADQTRSYTIAGKTIRAKGAEGPKHPQCNRDDGDLPSSRPDPKPDKNPDPGCGSCNGGGKDDTPNTGGSTGGNGGNNSPGGKDNDGKSGGNSSHGKGGKSGGGNSSPGPDGNGPSGPGGDQAGSGLKSNQIQYAGQTFTFGPSIG